MGNVSYSAHISNGKSAITSKKALAGVAKHNLRKYKSADYSSDNIRLIYGTTDLFQDVKRVYHREFDDVVKEYNSRQKREDRKIKDYFEHVAGLNQDMAAGTPMTNIFFNSAGATASLRNSSRIGADSCVSMYTIMPELTILDITVAMATPETPILNPITSTRFNTVFITPATIRL